MRVFDDVFTNAIQKYPEVFIKKLKESDILCRVVIEKECDVHRFIPFSECSSQNRWNPPGKFFCICLMENMNILIMKNYA